MLIPYRRHASTCAHASEGRRWNRCKCPIWVQGTLDGEPIRESLDTRNWTKANETVQKWEAAGGREEQIPELTPAPVQPKGVTIAEACAAFTAEMEAQKLKDSSRKKYRIMFKQFKAYCL